VSSYSHVFTFSYKFYVGIICQRLHKKTTKLSIENHVSEEISFFYAKKHVKLTRISISNRVKSTNQTNTDLPYSQIPTNMSQTLNQQNTTSSLPQTPTLEPMTPTPKPLTISKLTTSPGLMSQQKHSSDSSSNITSPTILTPIIHSSTSFNSTGIPFQAATPRQGVQQHVVVPTGVLPVGMMLTSNPENQFLTPPSTPIPQSFPMLGGGNHHQHHHHQQFQFVTVGSQTGSGM
jgi:hypothetical protein